MPSSMMGMKLGEALLQRVAAGDTAAVAACLDQYGGLVWSLARRTLKRPSEAEDAVQEIFIELWKNAARFDPDAGSETTFVAMIARRRLIDRARRSARRVEDEAVQVDELPLAQAETPPELDLEDEASRAAEVIQRLEPEQRGVLQLSVLHGWPHQLISDRLGLPLGTVKTHVRRGLLKVREELQAQRSAASREVD